MHPNPTYRPAPGDTALAFARERSFGALSINGTDGPLISHIPFHLSEDGSHANLHLARSGPVSGVVKESVPAVIAISGPDGYVSPDWYGILDQVPTWNYIAVHLRGRLEPRPIEELRASIDDLSEQFESRLAPKPIWRSTKMTDGVMERMMRMILPYRFLIDDIQGTWKLSQNKVDSARLGAANEMPESVGQDLALLASMMRNASSQ